MRTSVMMFGMLLATKNLASSMQSPGVGPKGSNTFDCGLHWKTVTSATASHHASDNKPRMMLPMSVRGDGRSRRYIARMLSLTVVMENV